MYFFPRYFHVSPRCHTDGQFQFNRECAGRVLVQLVQNLDFASVCTKLYRIPGLDVFAPSSTSFEVGLGQVLCSLAVLFSLVQAGSSGFAFRPPIEFLEARTLEFWGAWLASQSNRPVLPHPHLPVLSPELLGSAFSFTFHALYETPHVRPRGHITSKFRPPHHEQHAALHSLFRHFHIRLFHNQRSSQYSSQTPSAMADVLEAFWRAPPLAR